MSKVSYIVEFSIKDGKTEEFKKQAEGFISTVAENESGTLGYQWYLAADGSKCLIQETFESSEALLTHLANVGPSLPALMEIAPVTKLDVLGDVNDNAREALGQLNASFYPFLGGFER